MAQLECIYQTSVNKSYLSEIRSVVQCDKTTPNWLFFGNFTVSVVVPDDAQSVRQGVVETFCV